MRIIASPQVQEAESLKAYRMDKSGIEVKWVDVFALPDYEEYLRPFMGNISRIFKRSTTGIDWTQHQIIIEATDDFSHFPMGTRIMYRKYSSDTVYHIINKSTVPFIDGTPDWPLDYIPQRITVTTKPDAENNIDDRPAGLYVLQTIPTNPLVPAPFEPEIRPLLDNVVAWSKQFWHNNSILRDYINDWQVFASLFPRNDNVLDYVSSTNSR